MSTEYYSLKPPVTALTVQGNDILLWAGSHSLGVLNAKDEEMLKELLFLFFDTDNGCAETAAARDGIITYIKEGMKNSEVVLSEYGELFTIGELRSRKK